MRGKILIVDDDDDHRNAVQYLLEKQNYEVIPAESGKSGLKKLNENDDIRIIMTDLAMLDTSGIELLEKIKDSNKLIRRIVLTAHAEELSYKEANELNVFTYLDKPVKKHSLIFAIEAAFNHLSLEMLKEEYILTKQWDEIGILTTDFVHWVGNKISIIPNYLELIQNEVKSLSNDCFKKCNKINDIIKEVIRMKATLLEPFKQVDKEEIIIDNLLNNVISSLNIPNSISIYKNYEIKHQKILFNKIELQKIFEELIINALKAMANVITKKLTFTISEGIDNRILIKIKDTGYGIKKEDECKIFRAFYSMRGSKGYGIGLFTVKNTLAKYGGTIGFTSEYGNGTEFTISILTEEVERYG